MDILVDLLVTQHLQKLQGEKVVGFQREDKVIKRKLKPMLIL